MASEVVNTAIEDKALSISDLEDALRPDADDTKTDDKTDKKDDDLDLSFLSDDEDKTDEKTDDDDKSDEDKDKEDKPAKLELADEDDELEYENIPDRQDIIKAYPDIFKKFPSIERAIYREQQYAEVFPTIADAKAAGVELEQFKALQSDVFDGNIENLLNSIKRSDDKAFKKITAGLLDTFLRVDKDGYMDSAKTIIQATLNNIHESVKNAAKDSPDEQLKIAVKLLYKSIFNTYDPQAIQVKASQQATEDPKEAELKSREAEFETRRFQSALNETETRTTSRIRSAIEKEIDSKGAMTPYIKGKAIEDVMNEVMRQISVDARFKSVLTKKWEAARNSGYSEESLQKIRKDVLSKAGTLLPRIINKVKADALKGQATRTREAGESRDNRPLANNRSAGNGSPKGKSDPKSIPKTMTTLDYFNS